MRRGVGSRKGTSVEQAGKHFLLVNRAGKRIGPMTCDWRGGKELLPGSIARFRFSSNSPLVRRSRAFYNPGNTRAAAVVSFTRGPGTQPPIKNGCAFRVRVLEN